MRKRKLPDWVGPEHFWKKKEVIGVVLLGVVNIVVPLLLMRKNYWDGVEDLFSDFEPIEK